MKEIKKKYIYLDFKLSKINLLGFSHMFNNIINLIITSYNNNLIPIIPKIKIVKNLKYIPLTSNFSEYIDFENIKINNKNFKVILNIETIKNKDEIFYLKIENFNDNLIRWLNYFKLKKDFNLNITPKSLKNSVELFQIFNTNNMINYKEKKIIFNNNFKFNNNLNNIEIDIPYKKYILDLSNLIIKKLGKNYTCIHNRRGDDVPFLKSLNLLKYSEQEHILKILKKNNSNKNIYIMIHPLNKESFKYDKLLKNYKIFFYNNFEILNKIPDNNLLYIVENIIMDNALKKISFYRNYSELLDIDNYYDDFLIKSSSPFENNIFKYPYISYN